MHFSFIMFHCAFCINVNSLLHNFSAFYKWSINKLRHKWEIMVKELNEINRRDV